MDTRSHGMLVNAAGFLYASIGFSLSVLAALFSVFHRTKAQDVPTIPSHTGPISSSSPRGRRLLRSSSDGTPKASKPPSFSPGKLEEPIKLKEPSSEKKAIVPMRSHAHRRSKSMAMIPTITVDYFGSTDSLSLRRTSVEFLKTDPHVTNPITPLTEEPLPLVAEIPLSTSKSSTTSISRTATTCDDRRAAGFRLFGLKPWGKDRPKVLERRQSSPQLCQAPPPPASGSHKQTNSDGVLTIPRKSEMKTKSRKSLRKMQSAPTPEKFTMKFDVAFPRNVEKKRSQTLRTQPYDAPYFAPPPVPPLPVYRSPTRQEAILQSQSHDAETGKSLDKKLSKSRVSKS